MDIAIQLEKINLSDDRFLFKPIGVIKGKYLDDAQVFDTDFGLVCDSIECGRDDSDYYFDSPTTIEELREKFGDVVEEEDLLSEFLEIASSNLYYGYYDYERGFLNVKKVPFESFEDEEVIPLIAGGYDENDNVIFTFDSKSLKELRESETIEDFRKNIDQILSVGGMMEVKDSKPKEESKKKMKVKKEESKKFNLAKLREVVFSNIVGQDEAVNDVTRTLAINYTSINPRSKNHMLVIGPSGTGKTEIINIVAKEMDIPIFKADATAYTKAGYVGKDVPSMLTGLLEAANGDIKKAQRGILIIDEIDKKSSSSKDDVSGKSVLHSMLKMLDRDIIEVDIDQARNEKMMFDTSNLTVIFMGSFDSLYEEKQKYGHKTVGFGKTTVEEANKKVRIEEEDLIKWLGPEFVGRIDIITATNELTLEDVKKILTKSKISQLNIFKEELALQGIKLHYTSGYIEEIAKKGLSKSTGVRNLNKTVKQNIKFAQEEVMTRDNVKVLKLSKATALDPRKYFLG
ncbi:MAG: AAA family ATPase [Bacilli bacterium]|nr:AAA family ATPase [Bacilli bacterium]